MDGVGVLKTDRFLTQEQAAARCSMNVEGKWGGSSCVMMRPELPRPKVRPDNLEIIFNDNLNCRLLVSVGTCVGTRTVRGTTVLMEEMP